MDTQLRIEGPPVIGNPRLLAWVFLGAAVVAGIVGSYSLASGICPTCTGLLSVVLPWAGTVFYFVLALLAWRRPETPGLVHAMSFSVFVHACLVLESFLLRHFCVGCLVIAGLALAAAGLVLRRFPGARLTLAMSLVLGSVAGFLTPFDRLDDGLTRRFWPSKILERAPAFVDRAELASCGHSAPLRFIAYEDERTCRSCSSVSRRLIPALTQEFPVEVCIHKHAVRNPPAGQTLPVLFLMTRDLRLVIIEGLPGEEELRDLARRLLSQAGSPPAKNDPR